MRTIRRLAVVLVVLAGIGVAMDRVAAWLADQAVAERVAQRLARFVHVG